MGKFNSFWRRVALAASADAVVAADAPIQVKTTPANDWRYHCGSYLRDAQILQDSLRGD
jgi:hypothetical protein